MQKFINSILKFFLFFSLLFAFLLTANAQTANNNFPNQTDSLRKTKPDLQQPEEEKIYTTVDQMPKFPDGEKELLNFISKNIRYPISAQMQHIQGRVTIRFVVSSKGKVGKAEVLRKLSPDCDNEAVRVIRSLPDFIPGKQNGENVAVWFAIPIIYKFSTR